MGLTGKNNEEKAWNFLKGKIPNDFGVAGLMGELFAESGLNPQNLQNSYEKKLGFTDATYTAAVDSGSYANFVHDSAVRGWRSFTRFCTATSASPARHGLHGLHRMCGASHPRAATRRPRLPVSMRWLRSSRKLDCPPPLRSWVSPMTPILAPSRFPPFSPGAAAKS